MRRLKRILCRVVGHDYRITRAVNEHIRELVCDRCRSEFGMNDRIQAIVPLDEDLVNIHDQLWFHYRTVIGWDYDDIMAANYADNEAAIEYDKLKNNDDNDNELRSDAEGTEAETGNEYDKVGRVARNE